MIDTYLQHSNAAALTTGNRHLFVDCSYCDNNMQILWLQPCQNWLCVIFIFRDSWKMKSACNMRAWQF